MDCQSEILLNLLAFFFFSHTPLAGTCTMFKALSRILHVKHCSPLKPASFTYFFFLLLQFMSWCSFSVCVCVFYFVWIFFIIILLFGACCVAQPLPLLPFHPPISSKIKEKKEQSFFSPPEFFMWDWACKGKKNVKCYRLAACWVPSGFFSIVMLK